eukprot:1900231-Rhodomonas_salina.1
MAEAPDNDPSTMRVVGKADREWDSSSGPDKSGRLQQTGKLQNVPELQRRALRNFVVQLNQLWADVSLGSNTVFRKQLYTIKKMMGEASSELFHTIFLSKVPLPDLFSTVLRLDLTSMMWASQPLPPTIDAKVPQNNALVAVFAECCQILTSVVPLPAFLEVFHRLSQ